MCGAGRLIVCSPLRRNVVCRTTLACACLFPVHVSVLLAVCGIERWCSHRAAGAAAVLHTRNCPGVVCSWVCVDHSHCCHLCCCCVGPQVSCLEPLFGLVVGATSGMPACCVFAAGAAPPPHTHAPCLASLSAAAASQFLEQALAHLLLTACCAALAGSMPRHCSLCGPAVGVSGLIAPNMYMRLVDSLY